MGNYVLKSPPPVPEEFRAIMDYIDQELQAIARSENELLTADNVDPGAVLITETVQIADLVVTNAKIDDLDAGKLQAGTILSSSLLIEDMTLGTVLGVAENFNVNNDRNGTTPTAPTIAIGGVALDHTIATDSSATISFEWVYTTSNVFSAANNIDGFQISVRSSTSSAAYVPTGTGAEEVIYYVPRDHRAFIVQSVSADRYYTFGVRAYRIVDTDVDADSIVYSAFVKSAVVGENPYQPSSSVAFGGDITGTLNGTGVATVVSNAALGAAAAVNFNANNDRNGAVPTLPGIVTTGAAIDHTISTDGSATISFEFTYTTSNVFNAANNIDGFQVGVYKSTASGAYTFTGTGVNEAFFFVPRDHRSFILSGVPSNEYYTFAVRAYRIVDTDVDGDGIVYSAFKQSVIAGEHPYLPSATVAFAGDITGTIDGTAASTVVSNAELGAIHPATRINGVASTKILPGSVLISGTRTLGAWQGTDATKIKGGEIETGSILLSSQAPGSNPFNLLPNGNFEEGLTGWVRSGGHASSAIAIISATASAFVRSGLKSLQLNRGGASALHSVRVLSAGPTAALSFLPVEEGRNYSLTCWARGNAAAAAGFNLIILWYNGAFGAVGSSTTFSGALTTVYTEKGGVSVVAPVNARYARVQIELTTAAGTGAQFAYVDDVLFAKAVGGTLITPLSIDTPHLRSNIIEGQHVKAAVLTADKIVSRAITHTYVSTGIPSKQYTRARASARVEQLLATSMAVAKTARDQVEIRFGLYASDPTGVDASQLVNSEFVALNIPVYRGKFTLYVRRTTGGKPVGQQTVQMPLFVEAGETYTLQGEIFLAFVDATADVYAGTYTVNVIVENEIPTAAPTRHANPIITFSSMTLNVSKFLS